MSAHLKIKKINPEAKLPTRAHPGDAGIDIYCMQTVTLPPHEPVKIPTGIALAIPDGFVGKICDRSSMGAKGISTLGGIVDAGYRGEVHVVLINLRQEAITVAAGDRIAQMLILPVNLCELEEVQTLDSTSRSEKGFGSSGR